MPKVDVRGGDARKRNLERQVKQIGNDLGAVGEQARLVYDGLTPQQKAGVLNTLKNWDVGQASTRENALYAWCVLLTMAILYILYINDVSVGE